ncbi:MAG: hypothetical protein EPO13_05935 [Actinomycetota bacterium]|nr:MAG: hypothetical protein EPO13_05935 [Actinomycetota bacterium]
MTTTPDVIAVTPTEMRAAKVVIRLMRRRGEAPSQALLAIANATVEPTRISDAAARVPADEV